MFGLPWPYITPVRVEVSITFWECSNRESEIFLSIGPSSRCLGPVYTMGP